MLCNMSDVLLIFRTSEKPFDLVPRINIAFQESIEAYGNFQEDWLLFCPKSSN